MKKVITILCLMLFVTAFSFGNTGNYRVDDSRIEAMFSGAQEVSIIDFSSNNLLPGMDMTASPTKISGEPTPIVAFIICWVVGSFGIHRLYLGTETLTFIAYLCTAGGFGILVCGDWIVLLIGLINDDISKYVDNPALIMW